MSARGRLELVGIAVLLLMLLVAGRSWLAEHDARLRLDATVHDQQQVIAQAQAREVARDRAVADQLAAIERERHAVHTPAQAAAQLPQVLHLPRPIILPAVQPLQAPVPDHLTSPVAVPPPAQLPQEDLQPLYDFAQGCRETSVKLTACQADLADRQQELTAVETERDAAVTAVHGGTFWHRLAERAKWLALGVGVGVGLGVLGAHR